MSATARVTPPVSSPRRLRWRRWTIVLLVLCFLALRAQWFAKLAPLQNLTEGEYQVERVIDGDTLLLANGRRVRLIGVNCPETSHPQRGIEPFGPEAKEFTRRLLDEHAQSVTLRFDRERFDNYERYLAFVWVGDELLNDALLREGLARWESHFNYSASLKTRFRKTELAAREARRGVWSSIP